MACIISLPFFRLPTFLKIKKVDKIKNVKKCKKRDQNKKNV